MKTLFTPGRILILLANLVVSPGAYIADWNETHVKNPLWPPHARFHNGQTMSLGVLLATTSTYFAFKPALAAPTATAISTTNHHAARGASAAETKESVFYAALIGSFYCTAGLSSILYPGADWNDPGDTDHLAAAGLQKMLFPATIAIVWVGYFLEVRRLGKGKVV